MKNHPLKSSITAGIMIYEGTDHKSFSTHCLWNLYGYKFASHKRHKRSTKCISCICFQWDKVSGRCHLFLCCWVFTFHLKLSTCNRTPSPNPCGPPNLAIFFACLFSPSNIWIWMQCIIKNLDGLNPTSQICIRILIQSDLRSNPC
jgi:hypothetical protein